jgi:hypothetical protein
MANSFSGGYVDNGASKLILRSVAFATGFWLHANQDSQDALAGKIAAEI